ncbi:YiiX/YebB-like N1pC/P60 family cysteine hydrolase [Akkermansiaceae bacterium]|nr:YiiX/YebB-like N1pC/P60 family cysteine hydrolase [Akkermansiaceae bacterium]MDA7888372.1 YiiX/YebB-like N1pC/P60 family cysteine hydrolase [Akkermansiaceae bacterium]
MLKRARQTLFAIHPTLPKREFLTHELADAEAANTRGYFLPDEDERLREVFCAYLTARAALWEMIRDLRPYLRENDSRIFALAFCAAAALVRSATFLVDLAKNRPTVWKKLDEAEPRYGLQRKSFTQIYKNISSIRWMWRYQEASRYYAKHRETILDDLAQSDLSQVAEWLRSEEEHLDKSRRTFFERRYAYRIHSILRRHTSGYTKVMFHLFQLSGSTVAELRQPFKKHRHKGKRVSAGILEKVRPMLKPGDVLITRHDDAMSNLFLPGFWPHAALFLGSQEERTTLHLPEHPLHHEVLEAKKDGVLFRNLSETLAVDSFVVIRPKLSTEDLASALDRATTHEGKLYDFIFDFRKSDRLVCTEVIYRTYHSVGHIKFELSKRSGRLVLSAEDLLSQAIDRNQFEVVVIFGVAGTGLTSGEDAQAILKKSLQLSAS